MQDYRRGETITLYCLLGNILLSLLKGLAGLLGGSKAMVADALHSASDVIATLVVFVCLKIARKPADRCHPYGHGKIEPLAAAFVGLTLIITSLLIIADIVGDAAAHTLTIPSAMVLPVAVVSVVVKEVMFRVTHSAGRLLNSEAMVANAWDHRSDAWSSAAAFCGILGSIAGARYGLAWMGYLDAAAGLLVAGLIIKIAVGILLKAIRNLMDASPDNETMVEIRSLIDCVPGVVAVTWVRGRFIGRQLYLDMAVQVEAAKTVQEGHDIALSIKETIMENNTVVGGVLVHIDPYRPAGSCNAAGSSNDNGLPL